LLALFYLCSIAIVLLARQKFDKLVNPCSIYVFVWVFVVSLYNLNWVYYDQLTYTTYMYIIFFEIAVTMGIMTSYTLSFKIGSNRYMFSRSTHHYNDVAFQKAIDRAIIITACLSAISIIPNSIMTIGRYGIAGIMSNISNIYQAREAGELDYVNYFSPFIYITLVLVSVRIKKYGFKVYYVGVFLLAAINAISFGGRNNIVYSIILITAPFLIKRKIRHIDTEEKKKNRRRKIIITVAVIGGAYVLYSINFQRALNTVIPTNISPIMASLVQKNYSIYKTYQYLTEPLAYLNKFLEDPYFSFGANTFNFWYKQLNRFGLEIPRIESLPFMYIPMSCNVGTYITELIIDFGGIFSWFIVFLFGMITGGYYKRCLNDSYDIEAMCMISICYISIILSFFMWHVRSTNLWIAIIISVIVGKMISNRSLADSRE